MDKAEINLIKALISQEAGVSLESVQDQTKLGSLDIDSLSLLSICSDIEDKYKICLISTAKDIQELNIKNKTFKDFIDYISKKIDEKKK